MVRHTDTELRTTKGDACTHRALETGGRTRPAGPLGKEAEGLGESAAQSLVEFLREGTSSTW